MKFFGIILLILDGSLAINDILYPPQFTRGGRIIGGTDCPHGLAPYQVSLQYYGFHFCGGALIGSRWILTAAHCCTGLTKENITILTGTQNLSKNGKLHSVDLIKMHPKHNKPVFNNDIALIRLSKSIELNEETKLIDYATEDLSDNEPIILRLTGWGVERLGGEIPNILQILYVGYIPYKACKKAYNNTVAVGKNHICTLNHEGEGACHGDSGGPLVYNNKIVGVVNWGSPCALGYPDVHASVSFFQDWITKTMAENP